MIAVVTCRRSSAVLSESVPSLSILVKLDRFGRSTRCRAVRWQVLDDHRPCADDRPGTDGSALQDLTARPYDGATT